MTTETTKKQNRRFSPSKSQTHIDSHSTYQTHNGSKSTINRGSGNEVLSDVDKSSQVLLLGSYNGQDSLGDACLLRSVISQCEHIFARVNFVVHVNAQTEFLRDLRQDHKVESNPGLQTLSWLSQYYCRKSRLPQGLANCIGRAIFPVVFVLCALMPWTKSRKVLGQIMRSDVVIIFGGTNFAQQWFWRNIPYYFATTLIARICGARCYFSSQQYGPMTVFQSRLVDLWVRCFIDDYRLRNAECASIFERTYQSVNASQKRANEKVVWDEVYSNTKLYPIKVRLNETARYSKHGSEKYQVMMNVRGENFVSSSGFGHADIDWYVQFMNAFDDELKNSEPNSSDNEAIRSLQWVFFAVSGPGMAEDDRCLAAIKESMGPAHQIEHMKRITHETQLIEIANQSHACLSMSFHGCVLASFAGIPVVPFTSGQYYDYKYADFHRYGDGNSIPILQARGMSPILAAGNTLSYIRRFDSKIAGQRRCVAAQEMSHFYRQVALDHPNNGLQ